MRVSLRIASVDYPLNQVTLRREADWGTLNFNLAGEHAIAEGAACIFSAEGFADIAATVSLSVASQRGTSVSADLAPAVGLGDYAPERVQFRSSTTVRGDLDFSVLPGDTHEGIPIIAVTSTMGAASPWFTEVRF